MNKFEDIGKVFNLFYDGFIADVLVEEQDIDLKIYISHPEKPRHPEFETFYLRIKDKTTCYLTLFDDKNNKPKMIDDPTQIGELEPEILDCQRLSTGEFMVNCRVADYEDQQNYYSQLFISGKSFEILDRDKNKISIQLLKDLSEKYRHIQ